MNTGGFRYVQLRVEVVGPSGQVVHNDNVMWDRMLDVQSTAGGIWNIPPSTSGGEYILRVTLEYVAIFN